MALPTIVAVTVLLILLMIGEGAPKFDVKLSNEYFDGGFVFFPVKRTKVRQLLTKINPQFGNKDVKLALPSKPVLQDCEHVVMLSYGPLDALAFKDALTCDEKKTVSTVVDFLGIDIPYLTSDGGDKISITLQKDIFTPDVGNYIQPNVIIPTRNIADRLTKTENGNTIHLQFAKGDLQLNLTGIYSETIANDDHAIEDMAEYENEYQISQSGPDFSICEQFPDIQVDLCDIYRNPLYNAALKRAGTNVCIYWEPTADVTNHTSNFYIESISKTMKTLLLLDEDQNVFKGTVQRGTFDIRLVFPCIE